MDVRHLIHDVERAKSMLDEAHAIVERTQVTLSQMSSKLYDRDRYVESLEARLLELSQPASDPGQVIRG